MSDLLFIDDSGSKQWDTPFAEEFRDNPPRHSDEQNKKFWRGNYFVLGGLYTNDKNSKEINAIIDEAKMKYFGRKDIEFHSSDLRNPHQLKKKYLDKYNISKNLLESFINDVWYPILASDKMSLMAVILDKRYYATDRRQRPMPLEIVTETLFDRMELRTSNKCKIVFDQMDSQLKTHRRDQGKIFEISDTKINLSDGKYKDKYQNTSVRFEKSSKSNFLQLADMVAYNVWRQFVDYGDEWDKHEPDVHHELPLYPYFKIIADNFYHEENTGRVSGYGIVKLPDPNNDKIRFWKIDEK